MQYRLDRNNEKISALGFGCMRFTRKGTAIDYEKAEKEILLAIEKGVNYFDTAYIYPGSEVLLGEVLHKNNVRDKVNIATKLPPYLVTTRANVEKLFNEELTRLQTDHIDYYLLHMLTDIEGFNKLDALGIREWIDEKKADSQNWIFLSWKYTEFH